MSVKALPPASTLQWLLNLECALWSEWNGVGCLYIDFSTFHRQCVLTLHLRGGFMTYARRFCLFLEVSSG